MRPAHWVLVIAALALAGAFFFYGRTADAPMDENFAPLPGMDPARPPNLEEPKVVQVPLRFETFFTEAFNEAQPQTLREYIDVFALISNDVQKKSEEPDVAKEWKEHLNEDLTRFTGTLTADEVKELRALSQTPDLSNAQALVLKTILTKAIERGLAP